VQKNLKVKHTDNAKRIALETKRKNRLNSIKNELEAGRIHSFEQIFAIMSETRMSIELGLSFYSFRKKVTDPGEFTINELLSMASLFGVKYEIINSFVFERLKARSKSRLLRE
jgi:hypothetical protein